MIPAFSVARLPRIVFGEGSLAQVPSVLAGYGRRVLVVTGGRWFRETPHWPMLQSGLRQAGLAWEHATVPGEPSPGLVDEAVQAFRPRGIEVVLGIGGGSVLDAAKAIAGLLPHGNSVMDHLEGVGANLPYTGPATPFVAVPTTAGTGSEATKNAVLSVQGAQGFKKSFRHEALVPQVAVVDPALLRSCPPELLAANGMDALTQLLESYVSIRANPYTDALAESGLQAIRDGLFAAWRGGDTPEASRGRAGMAYGALLSGVTLAQAGLGSVHGLASPLGAYFPIPHGVVCGTLVAAATEVNVQALRARAPGHPALAKYAAAARLLGADQRLPPDRLRQALVEMLGDWSERLAIPTLGRYGVGADDVQRVVAGARGSSMQTNPIVLTDEEVASVVRARL